MLSHTSSQTSQTSKTWSGRPILSHGSEPIPSEPQPLWAVGVGDFFSTVPSVDTRVILRLS